MSLSEPLHAMSMGLPSMGEWWPTPVALGRVCHLAPHEASLEGLRKPRAWRLLQHPGPQPHHATLCLRREGLGLCTYPGAAIFLTSLLPTHFFRCCTYTVLVTCHFMLSCYTSAPMTHNFVPSSSSAHTASDVTCLLKVTPIQLSHPWVHHN